MYVVIARGSVRQRHECQPGVFRRGSERRATGRLDVEQPDSGDPRRHQSHRCPNLGQSDHRAGPGSSIAPEAAAVNSSGDAIVIYSGYDAAGVHTEYATNHQP